MDSGGDGGVDFGDKLRCRWLGGTADSTIVNAFAREWKESEDEACREGLGVFQDQVAERNGNSENFVDVIQAFINEKRGAVHSGRLHKVEDAAHALARPCLQLVGRYEMKCLKQPRVTSLAGLRSAKVCGDVCARVVLLSHPIKEHLVNAGAFRCRVPVGPHLGGELAHDIHSGCMKTGYVVERVEFVLVCDFVDQITTHVEKQHQTAASLLVQNAIDSSHTGPQEYLLINFD
mmetsp:Transcript_24437/g.60972  ORF Transcript_24437/g.60972 Transcript_24437/m.60972 type:complete len:233 (-) Transcript_24437:109-807(-)